jgi:hypothetical protein
MERALNTGGSLHKVLKDLHRRYVR